MNRPAAQSESAVALDLLTRALVDPPDVALVEAPDAWRIIKDNAGRHGLTPLIAYRFRSNLEGAERAWCDQVLTRSWRIHERNLRALSVLLEALDHARIRTLVLKGPLLGLKYYQPPFLRKPSTDIDLAVDETDVESAAQLLVSLGYHLDVSYRAARGYSHHVELSHADWPKVEIHFRLSHGALGLPIRGLFDWAVPQALPDGRSALVLDAPGQLLHLMLHRAWGRYATLFHLYEIKVIVDFHGQPILAEAVRRAIAAHFGGVVAFTDVAFRVRWRQPLLLSTIQPPKTFLRKRIDERLYVRFEKLSDPQRSLPVWVRAARRWIDLQLTDRLSDAASFSFGVVKTAYYQLLSGGWRTMHPRPPKSTHLADTQVASFSRNSPPGTSNGTT